MIRLGGNLSLRAGQLSRIESLGQSGSVELELNDVVEGVSIGPAPLVALQLVDFPTCRISDSYSTLVQVREHWPSPSGTEAPGRSRAGQIIRNVSRHVVNCLACEDRLASPSTAIRRAIKSNSGRVSTCWGGKEQSNSKCLAPIEEVDCIRERVEAAHGLPLEPAGENRTGARPGASQNRAPIPASGSTAAMVNAGAYE